MITLENTQIFGWEAAIRGMRNPMNSWGKSDSGYPKDDWDRDTDYSIGPNDQALMMQLAKGGPVHAKYRRMIVVYVDITAPLYWWKEFDTYKVGTVANSCSTMHKIQAKEFVLDDFSHDHLVDDNEDGLGDDTYTILEEYDGHELFWSPIDILGTTIKALNQNRKMFLKTRDRKYWWQMIQLLPSSYNQKRTIMMNYEVLSGIYPARKDHKLDEWHDFCYWVEGLPYAKFILAGEYYE